MWYESNTLAVAAQTLMPAPPEPIPLRSFTLMDDGVSADAINSLELVESEVQDGN